LDAHLGRCPRCIRQSFLYALGAWGAFGGSLALNRALITACLALAAFSLTLLWLAHLTVSAARGMAGERNDARAASGLSRRQLFSRFAQSLGTLALVTALPGAAAAQDRTQNCLTCCDKFRTSCGNGGDCNVNYQNCVNNCNAGGELPVTWRCW
jgi:hypothetical protein